MLKVMYELFRHQMRTTGRFVGLDNLIAFFPLSVCVALIAVGMVFGFAGSFVPCGVLARPGYDVLDGLGSDLDWGSGRSWPTPRVRRCDHDKIEKERKTLEKLKDQIEEKRKKADEAGKKRESSCKGSRPWMSAGALPAGASGDQPKTAEERPGNREDQCTDGRLRVSVRERQDAILARLRVQYMEGRFGHWKTLLASDSYGDFQRRLQYLSAVSQRDYDIMETFRTDMTRMEQAERQREEARVGMLAYKRSTEKKLAQIKSVKKEKKVYLTKITQEKESYERALQELERSASRVDSLLRELEQRRRSAAVRPPTGGSPLAG